MVIAACEEYTGNIFRIAFTENVRFAFMFSWKKKYSDENCAK